MSKKKKQQRERLKERILAMESHLDSIRCLHKNRIDGPDDGKSQSPFFRGATCHMLCAIVLELAIKVLWDLERCEDPKHEHGIENLYDNLAPQTQLDLKKMYHKKAKELAELKLDTSDGRRVRDLSKIAMTLEEVLSANPDIMKNFKYDNKFKNKSSAMGVILWNIKKDRVYILPSLEREIFPVTLFKYVKKQADKNLELRPDC